MSLLDTASLIVTPNGYKEGKLYSVIPSDGSGDMSVTRATTATRVNSAGLVELVPYNLLDYTERLDVPSWYKYFAYVNANVAIAPDGTLTADEVVITTTGGSVYKSPFDYNSGVFTISGYFKKNTASSVVAISSNPTSGYFAADYDLDTEVITPYGTIISSNIENVGNGWFRCSLTANVSGTGYVAYGVNGSAGGQSNFVWGVQINEGTLKPYQKTETRLNIPRLDYSNGTCPSLLVEPQRTNLFTYSEQLQTGTGGTVVVTPNTTISPSGIQNADTLSAGYLTKSVSASAGTYTFSTYAKYQSSNTFGIYIYDGAYYNASFNVSTGVVSVVSSGVTASIEDAGNGWYRCIMTATTANNISEVGYGAGSIYTWGAQLEVGSYATSYIPTTSASVTRNADVISKTGISSLIGQTEGTMFVDAYVTIKNEDANPVVGLITINNNVNNINNCIIVGIDRPTSGVNNKVYTLVQLGGATVAEIFTPTITSGRYKIAFAYKQNDFALYVNGVLIGTDTSGNVPTCTQVLLGERFNSDPYKLADNINTSALWKTRLTNTQLAELTTI